MSDSAPISSARRSAPASTRSLVSGSRPCASSNQAVAIVFLAIVAVPSMVGEGWLGLWLLLTRRFAR